MLKKLIIFSFLFPLWLLTTGTHESEFIKTPYSRISKTVKKRMGINNCQLSRIEYITDSFSQSNVFLVHSDSNVIGYVYLSRVSSCRKGGCTAQYDTEVVEFEYFDYYLLTDSKGSIISVKIFNYQATHGHQVMSRGWLKQFIGYNGSRSLEYGNDIQAISGATISATTLMHDVEDAATIIKSLIEE